MLRDTIGKIISSALTACQIDDEPHLTHPTLTAHGDFSTNVAMLHAKSRGVPPLELAREISSKMEKSSLIKEVTVAPPGFINITLSTPALTQALKNPINIQKVDKPQNILLEFGQPNTHKMPHIGHLFSYIYGESLARILEAAGHKVYRANYQGDIGPHVARCLWAVQKQTQKLESLETLSQKVLFLQECYQEGAKAAEEHEQAKEEIQTINKALYDGSDEALTKLWKETRASCVEYYQIFEESLGIQFDRSYFETEVEKVGRDIVGKHTPKIFQKGDSDAIVFKGEDYGLHTRVFINRFGNPTYETKELGLTFQKAKDFDFDLSITTTASEQNEYMKVVHKAIEQIDPKAAAKMKHIGYGMITLSTGKMSSRSGNIVTAMSLVNDDVTNKILHDYYEGDKNSITDARTIALAAIKYAFLQSDHAANKTFDIKKSVAREGDSGPYLQYAYVRTQAVLQQAPETSLNDVSTIEWESGEDGRLHDSERAVLTLLYRFPEIVEAAATSYSPHIVANYTYSLAQSFSTFYQCCPIIKASDKDTRTLRLAITKAVGDIIQKSLYLLGIKTMDKM